MWKMRIWGTVDEPSLGICSMQEGLKASDEMKKKSRTRYARRLMMLKNKKRMQMKPFWFNASQSSILLWTRFFCFHCKAGIRSRIVSTILSDECECFKKIQNVKFFIVTFAFLWVLSSCIAGALETASREESSIWASQHGHINQNFGIIESF